MKHFNLLNNTRWFATVILLLTFCIPHVWANTTDNLTYSVIGLGYGGNNDTYTDFTNKAATSDARYAGQILKFNKNKSLSTDNYLQFRATNPSGIVTTTSGGTAVSVTITWTSSNSSGRTVDIYGKNTAYETGADLYDSDKRGTKLGSIVYGTSTKLTITGSYQYIGIRSSSGTAYASNIAIEWSTASCEATPTVGAASLNGSFSLSSVGVQCASASAGDGCSLSEYGFVWGTSNTSGHPNKDDNVVTNAGAYTANYTNNLTSTFVAGNTYYYRGYAKNNGDNYGYSSVIQSFTPYTVNYNKNNGSAGGSAPSQQVVNTGGTVTLAPATGNFTLTGHHIDKWAVGSAGGTQYDPNTTSPTISANTTFYAIWEANTYAITLNQNGATTDGTTSVNATYNSSSLSSAITNPEKTHYIFNGWYSGSGGTGSLVISTAGVLQSDVTGYTDASGNWTATEAKTLYAKWTEHTYKNYRTVCCTDPGLAYGTGSVTKTYGEGVFTNTLTNTNSVSVTYTSSDETVATVDTDGEVTILKAGTTTITATSAAQKVSTVDYCADEASYTLIVNKADISPTLSYDPAAVTVGNTLTSFTLSGNTGSGSVSYSSSNDAIATVNSSGVVAGVAPGTVTITATIAATTNYNGNTATSNTITVNAAACTGVNSLHTGNKGQGGWITNQCFSDVDWGEEDDAIYVGAFPLTNECYVGYAGGGSYYGKNWAVGGIKTYDIPNGRTLGWNSSNYYESYPGGALGTFHIYTESTEENYYLRFKPSSYVLRTGSDGTSWTSRDMTVSASNSHYYETAELDLTSTLISEHAYVDLKTSGGAGHVWCNFSNDCTASGNVKVKSSVGDADGNFRGTNLQAGDAGTHGKFRIDITKDVDNWKLAFVPMYRITYAAGTGASGSMDPSSYAEISTTIAAAAESFTDPTGKQFSAWSDGVNTYAVGDNVTMNSNVTLTAQWTDIDYTVTVNQSPAAGATTTGQTSEAHYGGTINLTTTVPSGYAFVNWTTSDGFSITNSTSATTASFTMPAKNVTVTANFVRVDTYMTAMHETDDDWEDYAEGVTKAGDGYTIPNPGDVAKAGTGCEGIHYHFAGWVTEANKEAGTISGNIIPASGTTDATGTTYWAVWEKEAAGGAGAPVNTVLWAEDFSGWGDGDVPSDDNITNSHTGTTVYGSATLTYACVNGGSDTKLYGGNNILYAGGTKPELLVGKNTGTFTVSGIPNGGASEITVSYKQSNKSLTVSASGTGYSGDNTANTTATQSFDVTVGSASTFTLTFAATQNENARLDDISVKVKTQGITYEDPKVECVCSADPVAGTAAVDAEGTFSASSIAVKATGASTGHADCSYTDYGFVWSTSVTTPTLVEETGAASTNCTKVPVGNDGEVTSFTGSLEGSFSANNAIYFRSYAKNGKADGTYQYSSVVTITPRSVTFNLNGHGSSTPATQFVNNGSKATDPSYSESVTGYIFGGWYKEEGCSNAWNFATDVVSGESKTLYAKWTPISYSVRFNNNDDNYLGTATGSMSDQSFDYDEEKALTTNAFSLAGYDFAGWALTADGDVAYTDGASASNLSSTDGATVDLYAIWSPKNYDVTLAATDETSSVGSQTVTVTYNAAMPTTKKGSGAVAAPSRTGYTFTGWEYSSTTYYNYDTGTSTLSSAHVWDQPNSTTTLTPMWSINSYTLTWDLAGGTVSVAGTGAEEGATGTQSSSVVYNSAITDPTVTRAGYNFAGWDVDVAATMPASNVTYTATWIAKTLNSISLAEASISVYVGEIKYVNVIFDPTDILSKAFTQSVTPTYCLLTSYDSYNKIKITGGKAGADISVNRTETVGIKYTADITKTASITVTVKPLPTVTFVDLIHNKSDFANSGDGWTAGTGVLSSTVTTGVVSHAKKTPTHTDVSAPVGGNACETGHLHLMGWIRSDYSKVADYMNGTGAAPTVSELTSAGTEYWFLPDADINTETYNGKTFYAVWAVEE